MARTPAVIGLGIKQSSRAIAASAVRRATALPGPSRLQSSSTSTSLETETETRPSDLYVDRPQTMPTLSSWLKLRENAYASTYDVAEEDLPPLSENDLQTINLNDLKITFRHAGILISRLRVERPADAVSMSRLRDLCRCDQCIDPSTRQKLRTSGSALDAQLSKAFAGFDPSGASGVHFTWSDGHKSFFSEKQLRDMVLFNDSKTNVNLHFRRQFWDKEGLEQSNLRMKYEDVQSKEGLFEMLKQAQVWGLVVVSGVPAEKTSDRDCELRRFMNRIGEIRNTFYGETWDVKTMANSKNVAYTSQDLGLHMDLLYFTSPPRWQALHCLKNKAQGGSSYFADAFFAAKHLQSSDPVTTATLARYPLDFEYDNDGHYLRCRHFVLNHLDSLRSHVNWSPPFQGPMTRAVGARSPYYTFKVEKELYDALAKFEATLTRPGVQYEFTMAEGDLVFFDNRRVLHARRAFSGGDRWLKGCYLDGEVVWDKLVTMH